MSGSSKVITEAELFTLLKELLEALQGIRQSLETLAKYKGLEMDAGGYIV